jgi:hypothetical protein
MVSGAVPSSLRHDPSIVRSLPAPAMGSSVLGAWRRIGCGRQKGCSERYSAAHWRGGTLVGSYTSGDGFYCVVHMTRISQGAKKLTEIVYRPSPPLFLFRSIALSRRGLPWPARTSQKSRPDGRSSTRKSSARHGKSLQGDRDRSIGGFLLPKFNGCHV